MNADSLLSLVIAVLCVTAVGVAAATIESTVSTAPDDAIDIDPDWFPFGYERLADAKSEMQANEGDEREGSASVAPADGTASGESREERAESEQLEHTMERAEEELDSALDRDGVPESDPGLLERLLDLLRRALPAALVLGSLLALLALGRRYADRLREVLFGDGERGSGHPPWPPDEPGDEVGRAWLTMVSRLDAEQPRSRTPGEWAAAAVDAGLDPDAVESLTRTFAEVRYGGAPLTPSRRRRIRESLDRLGLASGRGFS